MLLLGIANAAEPTNISGATVTQNGAETQNIADQGVTVQFWLANDTTDNVVSSGTLHVVINHTSQTKSVEIVNKTIDVKETDFQTDTSALASTHGWFVDTGNIVLNNQLSDYITYVDVYLTFTTPQGKVLTKHENIEWRGIYSPTIRLNYGRTRDWSLQPNITNYRIYMSFLDA